MSDTNGAAPAPTGETQKAEEPAGVRVVEWSSLDDPEVIARARELVKRSGSAALQSFEASLESLRRTHLGAKQR